MAGRFAPSPTSDLHLGNLRTALVAWLWARSTGRPFLIRVEDLDRGGVAVCWQVPLVPGAVPPGAVRPDPVAPTAAAGRSEPG